jgi:predicted permease
VQQDLSSDSSSPGKALSSFGRSSGWGMFAMPMTEFIGGNLRKPLMLLLTAVGMVLLIACANIAGLQMARASARERDLAIRVALGASRSDLIRQALIESIVLTVGGLALGFVVAYIAAPLLLKGLPPALGSNLQLSFGGPVLLFVIGIAVACSLLCGLVPAWQRTQPGWFNALQEAGRSGTAGRVSQRVRSSMVVGQIALSLLLIAGAGLLLSSLKVLERVETGFQPRGVLSARVSLPSSVYKKDEEQAAFYSALQQRLSSIPGVSSAALVDQVPFSTDSSSSSFRIQSHPTPANEPGPHGNIRSVSPDYFVTLGIPRVQGRDFTPGDRKETQLVAIVDDVLARQYWPGQNPIGQHIGFDSKGPWYEIVGVVGHARASSLESDTNEGFYYLPMAQAPAPSGAMMVRSSRSPDNLTSELAAAVRSVDSSIPIYDVKPMEQRVDESLIGRRFVVLLLTTFAGLALLLAALGLYGVISYSVRMRTRELGVRMALGAQRSKVLGLVLLQGVRLAAIGVVLGAILAAVLSRLFSSLLFQVKVLDVGPWLVATALLVMVVLLASYLPARRAASIEPIQALRNE